MLNLSALVIRFQLSPVDVIHVQYLPMLKWRLPFDFWFLELSRKRGSKIVLTVHDLLPHDTADAYKQTFERLYAMADAIICHSDHIKKRLRNEFAVPDAKVAVIPHGPFFYDLPCADPENTLKQLEIEQGNTLVLWQGIIFPYKGVDLLLDSWKAVEAVCENTCLVIAGTGPPELLDGIQKQVVDLGLTKVKLIFRFLSTEELVAIYRTADVVVYPYRAITTSGALATGLALGKAILASDLPVFREMLVNGENALLVDPLVADDLAGALIELVQNPELRQRLADNIREMNFGDQVWQLIADKTMRVYEVAISYNGSDDLSLIH